MRKPLVVYCVKYDGLERYFNSGENAISYGNRMAKTCLHVIASSPDRVMAEWIGGEVVQLWEP